MDSEVAHTSTTESTHTHVDVPQKNGWKVVAFIFFVLFLVMTAINVWAYKDVLFPKSPPVTVTPTPGAKTRTQVELKTFTGTVKSGSDSAVGKNYCATGLYLVANEGQMLTEASRVLQLRVKEKSVGQMMLSGEKYVDKPVEVKGIYPAQENFCEALICECEDYILIDTITILSEAPKAEAEASIEGTIVCLPHKNTQGPQTLECAYGLKDNVGNHYGLKNLNQQDLISGKITVDKAVTVKGVLTPDIKGNYDIVGTINVKSVE